MGRRTSPSAALLALLFSSCALQCLGLSIQTPTTLVDSLTKRYTNTTVIPAPIGIAPSQYWDGNDGPWSSFPMTIGNHAQNIRVMVSTAGYNVWAVQPAGCPSFYPSSCPGDRGGTYNYNNSLTWSPDSIYNFGIEQNLGLDGSGYYGFDTATFGWQGSGGPTFSHSVVSSFQDTAYWLGLFGLKPLPTNFTDFASPQQSWMQYLKNTSQIPSVSYGYTAGNQYRLQNVFGSLTLGGYDASRFSMNESITVGMYTDISRDLLVGVQSITTGNTDLSQSTGGFYAYIDSTIGQMWLPISVCQAFEKAFGLTWNSTYGYYLVNASLHAQLTQQNPSVTFTLGASTSGGNTTKITLPYGAFDLNVSYPILEPNNTMYYFPLKQAQNDSQYTLGRAFLQEAYLIADYDAGNFSIAPCTWNTDMSQDLHAILPPGLTIGGTGGSGSSFSAGAIAGTVVGIVAAIALIALIVFLIRRRKAQRSRADEKSAAASNAGQSEPSSTDEHSQENKPFLPEVEGDTTARHELEEPKLKFAAEMDSPHQHNEMEGEGDVEYFTSGKEPKLGASEMEGHTPVYEMQGSEVHEMPTAFNDQSRKNGQVDRHGYPVDRKD